MKKIMYIMAVCLAFAACSKVEQEKEPGTGFKKGEVVTLTASVGDQTKVSSSVSGNDVNFIWDKGDKILVTVGSGADAKSAEFTLTDETAGQASGTFKGVWPKDGDTFSVRYPVTDPVLSTQSYEASEGGFPKNKVIFAADNCTQGTNFEMASKSAVVRFDFKGNDTKVGSIKVTNKSNSETYTLSCPSGGIELKEDNPKHFFMVLPNGTYGIKVEVSDINAKTICGFETTQDKTFEAGSSLYFPTEEVGDPMPETLCFKINNEGDKIESHTWDKYDAATQKSPTVTGAPENAKVEYSSSDTDKEYVEINAETGAITANKVTPSESPITVSAKVSATGYSTTTISYELTIIDTAPVDKPIEFKKGTESLTGDADTYDFISTTYVSPTITDESRGDRNVKYEITKQSVAGLANIDENDGTVTFNTDRKTGTVTVKATAAKSTTYTEATKEYTLTVIDSNIEFKQDGQPLTDNKVYFDFINGTSSFKSPIVTKADGDDRTLSYSVTSGSDVATVNEKTGTITFNTVYKTGDVVVKATATAGAGSKYTTKDVSYTLTVSCTPHFVKVTSTSDLSASNYYIITNTADTYAFKCILVSQSDPQGVKYYFKNTENAQAVTVSNGTIQYSADNHNICILKIEPYNNNYSIFSLATGTYFTTSNDKFPSSTDIQANVISNDGDDFKIKGSNGKTISYNNGFKVENNQTVHLWRYVGAIKYVTSISLDATASISVGDTKQLTPTITPTDAFDQSCTWTSSNSSVATVDASGKVTAVSAGTAKITCTANGAASGSTVFATCTVTVTAPTYKKVTSITSGKTYLIVSSSKALNKDNGATDVTISDNIITSTSLGNCEFTITANNVGNTYAIKNISNNKYLAIKKQKGTIEYKDKIDESKFSFNNNQLSISVTDKETTNTYYLVYNKSWQYSTSSGTVYLYEKQ